MSINDLLIKVAARSLHQILLMEKIMMYRIVSTSLLLAAGIAVSACNVTTSSVTQPSDHGYTYAGGNDDKWEAEVQVASSTQLSSNNANWDSSPGGSGDTSGDNADNGNTNAGGQSGGASDSSGEPDKDGPGANQAATAAAADASRQNRNEQGELDKDGPGATPAPSQPQREIVSAGVQKTEDGGRIAEAQYSDGTFSRDFFDADGNHIGSQGGTL
jgi:hypothetical protein